MRVMTRPGLSALWVRPLQFAGVLALVQALHSISTATAHSHIAVAPPLEADVSEMSFHKGQKDHLKAPCCSKRLAHSPGVVKKQIWPSLHAPVRQLKVEEEEEPLGTAYDLTEVQKLKAIMATLKPDNNTVIVVESNLGYVHMARNLLCRLQAFNASNVLVWSLGNQTHAAFTKFGVPSYYDPKLRATSSATSINRDPFMRMMKHRPRVWWRLLKTGRDILFLDADVVLMSGPGTLFPRKKDLEAQYEWSSRFAGDWRDEMFDRKPLRQRVNGGVFWFRSSAKSLKLIEKVQRVYEHWRGYVHEQVALNFVLWTPKERPKGFRFAQMPPRRLLNGELFKYLNATGHGYNVTFSIQPDKQWKGKAVPFTPRLIHLNFHRLEEKIKIMKEHGWWELGERLTCMKQR